MQSDTYKFKTDRMKKECYQRIFDENPEARILTISHGGSTLVAIKESWLKCIATSGLSIGKSSDGRLLSNLNSNWGWANRDGYPTGYHYWWDSADPDRLAAEIRAALDWKDNRIEVKVTSFK